MFKYIGNRISYHRHASSEKNPMNYVSRSVLPTELKENKLWWEALIGSDWNFFVA